MRSSRPLPALLLFAALLITGCAGLTRKAPQATERANGAVSVLAGANEPQATPDTFLMGENGDFGGSAPLPEPTTDAALQAALQQAADARQAAESALQQLNDQNERMSENNKAAAEAGERTAVIELTKIAKSGEIDTSLARETTAQMDAANEAAAIKVDADKAQAAQKEADARTILALCVTVITSSMVLLAVRALARHPLPVAVVHGENVTRPMVPTGEGPSSYHVRELPVEPEVMARFMRYATQGKPLGTGNMESAHIFKSTERRARTEIITYLDKIGHLAHDTGLILSDKAMVYWLDWLQKYAPAPDAEIAETVAYTRHGHDISTVAHGENTEGVGLDDFKIMPQDGQDVL